MKITRKHGLYHSFLEECPHEPETLVVGFKLTDQSGDCFLTDRPTRIWVEPWSPGGHPVWLYISTDRHEETAMMRIETLPLLQRALRLIAKRLKDGATGDSDEVV